MIPIGFLIQLLDKLLSRQSYDEEANPWHRVQHLAAMKAAALRLRAEFMDYGRRMVLMRDGVRVEVKFQVQEGRTQRLVWSVSGRPPGFPMFRVAKRAGLRGTYGKKLGKDAIPHFPASFATRAHEGDAFQLLWSEEHCQRLARHFRDATITSDGVLLEVVCPSYGDHETLDAGVELCLSLGSSDVYATHLLRDLRDATYHHEALPYAQLGDARLGYARDGSRIVSEAQIAVGAIEDAAATHARELGATRVEVKDGRVVLGWPSVIRDKQRLAEVVELVRAVSTPRDGVFR